MKIRLLNARHGTFHQVPVDWTYELQTSANHYVTHYMVAIEYLPPNFAGLEEAIEMGASHYDAEANEVILL